MRFLNEDPWERLRLLKKHIVKTPIQMLLRGQNLVGYRHYADDIVERFIVKAHENGVDIFRIFDALNDVRNMEHAMGVAKRDGAHVQATISYTISPVHTNELFAEMARQLADIGADSICIKDMAGLISPYDASDLVQRIKERVDLPVQIHCHSTSGMATAAYLKAIEAGVDVVDTAISSLALGTSQPPTESLVSMLSGTPYDTGLDLKLIVEISKYFAEARKKYHAFEVGMGGVDTDVLVYQIPGGMTSNLVSQLREQGAEDRLPEVLQELPRVRAELGYPSLVTPTSQIVGTQAVLNVILGERYKMVPNEVRAYVRGLYGKPPAPVDENIRKRIIGDEKPFEGRPADLLSPEYDKAAKESEGYAKSEEDVLSYAIFPQVAMPFFKKRAAGDLVEPDEIAAIAAALLPPATDGQSEPQAPASGWRMTGRPWLVRRGAWR